MNRKKAREYAFVLLFEYKFQPEEIDRLLEDFVNEFNPGEQQAYVEKVVRGVVENIEDIDKRLVRFQRVGRRKECQTLFLRHSDLPPMKLNFVTISLQLFL